MILLRLLLVLVATLQICVLGETWQWTVATMVVGVLTVEALRGEHGHDEQDPTDGGERTTGAQ